MNAAFFVSAAMRRVVTIFLSGFAVACAAMGASAQAAPLTWNLSDLYADVDAWAAAEREGRAAAATLERFKGTLGRDAGAMYRALSTVSGLRRTAMRLSTYATLQGDEDLRVAPPQERRQQAQSLSTLIDEKSAWVAPEVIALGPKKVAAFLAKDTRLRQHFDHYLLDILRKASHTLSPQAEAVLAAAGDVTSQPNNVYQQLSQAELPFPTIELSSGEKVRLDDAAYTQYRTAASRADRKLVFDAFWGAWKGYQGTLGANLTTAVIADVFMARASRFGSALEAALDADNMPPAVYKTLVAQTNAALPTLHRYLRLRKRLLGIDGELAYYDNYPTLFPAAGVPTYSVDESERITLAALAPLGNEYLDLLRRGFAASWMNVLPSQGKATGAYMNGAAYDVHPYLLLNHTDDYESLSTLAHEWGHAMHTLLTDAQQPFEKSEYSTFIAESAAIANEMLLNDYLVEHARSKDEKLYYLGEGLDSIRGTFFRQVMFAEFQLAMHEDIEQGRPLSGERLTQQYCTLLRRYQGEAEGVMKIDPSYCTEWAAVPHFYYGFYVYQYATSMAGAAELTAAIEREGPPARDRFLAMLKAGGSDYPYTIYRRAGLDMASPAPYQALVARMNRVMDQIETLVGP